MPETLLNHIFPKQFGLLNVFTTNKVSSDELYYIYMNRKKELSVNYHYQYFF